MHTPACSITVVRNAACRCVNLSAITAVNNNPNLKFRILFIGDLAAGASGNNRFDNILVEGVKQ